MNQNFSKHNSPTPSLQEAELGYKPSQEHKASWQSTDHSEGETVKAFETKILKHHSAINGSPRNSMFVAGLKKGFVFLVMTKFVIKSFVEQLKSKKLALIPLFLALGCGQTSSGRGQTTTRSTVRHGSGPTSSQKKIRTLEDDLKAYQEVFTALQKINDEQDDDIERLDKRIAKLENIIEDVIKQINKNAARLDNRKKDQEIIKQEGALVDEMRREKKLMEERRQNITGRRKTRTQVFEKQRDLQKHHLERSYQQPTAPVGPAPGQDWATFTSPEGIHQMAQDFQYAQDTVQALMKGDELPKPEEKRQRPTTWDPVDQTEKNHLKKELSDKTTAPDPGPEPKKNEPDHRLEKVEEELEKKASEQEPPQPTATSDTPTPEQPTPDAAAGSSPDAEQTSESPSSSMENLHKAAEQGPSQESEIIFIPAG